MMRSRFLFLVLCMLILNACQQTEKSKEMLEQSVDAYFAENQDLEQRVEKSLVLVNKALEYDERNFSAYDHKLMLLFHKRDLQGLLETNSKMVQLRPEHPYYILQRGLCRDLSGDSAGARQDYQQALTTYKDLLDKNPADFDLSLTYLTALEASGDTIRSNALFSDMQKNNTDTIRAKIIDQYMNRINPKELLIKYFRGEIEYDELNDHLEQTSKK